MTGIMSIVSAQIAPERADEVMEPFRRALRAGLPERRQTSLLRGEDGSWKIVTFWGSRRDLDAYLTSVEEPFATRLLREAGGAPTVEILDVVLDSNLPWWP